MLSADGRVFESSTGSGSSGPVTKSNMYVATWINHPTFESVIYPKEEGVEEERHI